MTAPIQHDEAACVFRLEQDDEVVHLDYVMRGERVMDTTYTYTPPALRGRGLASRVVGAAMEYAQGRAFRVVPSCWYVAGWIARHPEYERLVTDQPYPN